MNGQRFSGGQELQFDLELAAECVPGSDAQLRARRGSCVLAGEGTASIATFERRLATQSRSCLPRSRHRVVPRTAREEGIRSAQSAAEFPRRACRADRTIRKSVPWQGCRNCRLATVGHRSRAYHPGRRAKGPASTRTTQHQYQWTLGILVHDSPQRRPFPSFIGRSDQLPTILEEERKQLNHGVPQQSPHQHCSCTVAHAARARKGEHRSRFLSRVRGFLWRGVAIATHPAHNRRRASAGIDGLAFALGRR